MRPPIWGTGRRSEVKRWRWHAGPEMVGRIVLSILVVTLALAATAVAATPSVRLAGLSPFRVQGVGFRPAERVIVDLLYAGKDRTAAVTATAGGAFVVSFGRLRI